MADYGEYFAVLALEPQKLGCESAALLVTKRTLELIIYFTCSNLSALKAKMVVNLRNMIFMYKEMHGRSGLGFVEQLGALKTAILCK